MCDPTCSLPCASADTTQRDTFQAEGLSPAPKIVIANSKDAYASKAEEDGFGFTSDWGEAAKQADVLFLLVPDQVGSATCPELFYILNSGADPTRSFQ